MNWKIFKDSLIPVTLSKGIEIDLFFVLLVVVILALTAILITKARPSNWLRRLTQLLAIIILGVMFYQCLANAKNIAFGFICLWKGCASYFAHNIGESSYYFAFAVKYLWFPSIIVVFVILFGKRLYCYWFCPLGFIQDIAGKIDSYKRKHLSAEALKLVNWIILILLAIVVSLVGWLKWPKELVLAMGAWYGFILIIVLFFILSDIVRESKFRALKYFILVASLIGWVVGYDNIELPMCVIGDGKLGYSHLITFFTLIAVSMIIPRAWCKYACPDGAFFQLLNGKKNIPEADLPAQNGLRQTGPTGAGQMTKII